MRYASGKFPENPGRSYGIRRRIPLRHEPMAAFLLCHPRLVSAGPRIPAVMFPGLFLKTYIPENARHLNARLSEPATHCKMWVRTPRRSRGSPIRRKASAMLPASAERKRQPVWLDGNYAPSTAAALGNTIAWERRGIFLTLPRFGGQARKGF